MATKGIRMKKIAVIGLGYVGLPLPAAFGERREIIGFDVNALLNTIGESQ
ncbi:hypothetical protein [Marinobacter alexandrii]